MYREALIQDLQLHPAREAEAVELPSAASVAVVVGPADSVLLIRRAERQGDPWSGHMAFPGGKWQQGDLDLRATAAREAHEEVGLDLAVGARFLGRLGGLLTPTLRGRHPMTVTPFVFALDHQVPLTFNAEVASTHWIDLGVFVEKRGRTTMTHLWKGQELVLPCIHVEGQTIWGLTLRMLDDLVRRVERSCSQARAEDLHDRPRPADYKGKPAP